MIIFIAFIAMTVPVLGFVLTLAYFNQYKRALASALLCGLAFSAAIYGYIPDDGNDIFRHMANLSFYEGIPLWDAFDLLKTSTSHISTVYTWDLWLWIVAQFDNPGLLQSSGAFVGYSITSYMVFDYARSTHMSSKTWLPMLMAFFAFTSPLNLAIGIRNGNAFLLCVLAFYLRYFKGTSRLITIGLLVIALLLHHSVIIIILLWLGLPFFIKNKVISMLAIIVAIISFSNYDNYFYVLNSGNDISILKSTMYSAVAYQNSEFNNSLHAIVDMIWRMWGAVFLLYLTKKTVASSNINGKNSFDSYCFNFAFFIFIISTVLLFTIGNNGFRFLNVLFILCLLLLLKNNFIFSIFKNRHIDIYSLLLFLTCLGNCIFIAYNMNWGTGSFLSIVVSSLLGYLTPIIVTF